MRLDQALAECPVVAILRGIRPDEVVDHAAALHHAGVRTIEVPLNSPEAFDSIERLCNAFSGQVACGAGTVLSPAQVDVLAGLGGSLVVSPNSDSAVIARAVTLNLDPVPGFGTATEAFAALAAGARHLKLFPAATYGVGHLRQLKAVLSTQAAVWAVGGVGPASLGAWRAAGALAFGLGAELYSAGQSISDTRAKAAAVMSAARALAPSA